MDTRTKQLIAIGAAVTANCIPCIQGLVKKARQDADILGIVALVRDTHQALA